MKIRDAVIPHVRNEDWPKVDAVLDAAGTNSDADERASIAFWRAESLAMQKRYEEALEALVAHRSDFHCKSLPDTMRAKIFAHLGRRREALAASAEAVSNGEDLTFPGLAREAKFYRCLYLAQAGMKPPPELFDDLPDDYRSMDLADRFITKKDILDALAERPGSP
jgi:hypothetical protein